ncbi:unnamed protein product [Symbiodinium natans]|uniref:Uncharacterized protein n=1 Tax=Symbiodinium natans TaxID=878477 RepID=A0A812M5X9_9DINO|nr:unnamed protein product [Symbiodinium natans]
MPSIGAVDVPNWCVAAGVAGAAVLTPAAIYAYLVRQCRARQALFAEIPQPKEPGPIFAGIAELQRIQGGHSPVEPMKEHFKDLGLTWGGTPASVAFFLSWSSCSLRRILPSSQRFNPRRMSSIRATAGPPLLPPFPRACWLCEVMVLNLHGLFTAG